MRLTKKRTDGLYEPTNELYGQENGIRLAQKLGQYEEIEQEFEIDNFEDLRERLKTYKFLANHEMSCIDVEGYNCMLKDLKKYHDIEEELGIDLITLFKALKNGVYVKSWSSIKFDEDVSVVSIYTQNPGEKANKKLVLLDSLQNYYAFKDYGKTWALTKEELK